MKVIYEYIWLDVDSKCRSKIKVCDVSKNFIDNLPSDWNYDGSSTGQADGNKSEIIIKPVAMYNNPFYETKSFLVMCQTFKPDGTHTINNHYYKSKKFFDAKLSEEPWFGIEQRIFYYEPPHNNKPLGFDETKTQGQYYCGVGTLNAFGRYIIDEHLESCINAGLNISGVNAEVAPGQWEYQIGPCVGIESGNQVWVSRYILERIAEKHGVKISWKPKPIKGDWNEVVVIQIIQLKMRQGNGVVNGLEYIYMAIDKLETKHSEHMKVYGVGNEDRMTGARETASYDKFSYGIGDRGVSIRIGNDVLKKEMWIF